MTLDHIAEQAKAEIRAMAQQAKAYCNFKGSIHEIKECEHDSRKNHQPLPANK